MSERKTPSFGQSPGFGTLFESKALEVYSNEEDEHLVAVCEACVALSRDNYDRHGFGRETPGAGSKNPKTRNNTKYKVLSGVAITAITLALATLKYYQSSYAISKELTTLYSPGRPLPSAMIGQRDILQIRAFSWKLFAQGVLGLAIAIGGTIIVNEFYSVISNAGRLAVGVILAGVGVIGYGWTGRRDLIDNGLRANYAHHLSSHNLSAPAGLRGDTRDWTVWASGETHTTLFKHDGEYVTVAHYDNAAHSKRTDEYTSQTDQYGDVAYSKAWAGNRDRAHYFDTNSNDWTSVYNDVGLALYGNRQAHGHSEFFEACVVPMDSQGKPVCSMVISFNNPDEGSKLGECQDAAYARFSGFSPT